MVRGLAVLQHGLYHRVLLRVLSRNALEFPDLTKILDSSYYFTFRQGSNCTSLLSGSSTAQDISSAKSTKTRHPTAAHSFQGTTSACVGNIK